YAQNWDVVALNTQQQQQHNPHCHRGGGSPRYRPKIRDKPKKQNRSTRKPPFAMAHDAQIAGAADGAVPMDIDSGTRRAATIPSRGLAEPTLNRSRQRRSQHGKECRNI
ncbi:hypothetical protein E4U58_005969, partial [Claviceps cyperi]